MSIPQDSNQRLPSLSKINIKPQQGGAVMKTQESERYSFYDPKQEQESYQFYDIEPRRRQHSRDNSATREMYKSKQSSSYRSISIDNKVPGPGSYMPNYDSIFPNQSSQTMPKSPREIQSHEKKPEPGTYNYNGADIYRRKNIGNTRFSHDKRKFFNVKTEYDVGPGQYNIDNSFTLNTSLSNSKTISFTQSDRKLTKLPESLDPGPGRYNPQIQKQPKNTLFTQSRIDDQTSMYAIHQVIPGVGTYTVDMNKAQKSSPRAVFSSEKRFYVKDKAIPPPNAYNIPSKFDSYIVKRDNNFLNYSNSNSRYNSKEHNQYQQNHIHINENFGDEYNNNNNEFKSKAFSIKSIKLKAKKPQNNQNN